MVTSIGLSDLHGDQRLTRIGARCGLDHQGAQRWLDLGFFHFAALEIAKVSVLIATAGILQDTTSLRAIPSDVVTTFQLWVV